MKKMRVIHTYETWYCGHKVIVATGPAGDAVTIDMPKRVTGFKTLMEAKAYIDRDEAREMQRQQDAAVRERQAAFAKDKTNKILSIGTNDPRYWQEARTAEQTDRHHTPVNRQAARIIKRNRRGL